METFSLCSLYQLVAVDEGHGAHEMHGQLRMLVRHDVAAEELTEVLHHQVAEQRIVNMILNIQRSSSKEAVGHRLSIYLIYNVCLRQLLLLQVLVADVGKLRILEDGIHKQAT